LSPADLEEILSANNLRIASEDWLFEFIISLGNEYQHLLGYIECSFLSGKNMIELLQRFSREEISGELWNSICRRLALNVSLSQVATLRFSPQQAKLMNGKRFKFVEGHPFEGIISHLAKRCGGNVHLNGVVGITGCSESRNRAYQVVDFGWNDWWKSGGVPMMQSGQWIRFDFKEAEVCLKNYSLKSDGDGTHLLSWVVEGSNDSQEWQTIDRRHTHDLDGQFVVKNFACDNDTFYRYIRLRQTGRNSGNTSSLSLCNMEFFGYLSE
jgi:hypothetical protein